MSETNDEQQVQTTENEVAGDQQQVEQKEVVTENESSTEQTQKVKETVQEYKDLSDDEIDGLDAPQSLKVAVKREKRRLRKERQEKAKLREELEKYKTLAESANSQQELNGILADLQSELDLDEESTQKFYRAVKKITGDSKPNVSKPEGLTQEQLTFAQQASQIMATQYAGEDQAKLSQYAQKEVEREMKELEQMGLDPNDALSEGPNYYIVRAIKRMALDESNKSSSEAINRKNQINLATSESSKNGVGKSTNSQAMNQDYYDKHRHDLSWVTANKEAIKQAYRDGKITR